MESPYAVRILNKYELCHFKHVLMIFKLGNAYDVMRLKNLTHKCVYPSQITKSKSLIGCRKALNSGEQLPLYGRME